MRTPTRLCLPVVVVLIAGCGGRTEDARQYLLLSDSPDHASTRFAPAECPTASESTEMDRACMVDSNGGTYPENGTMFALPAAPPYGVYFQFKPGFVPNQIDVDGAAANGGIVVAAAPYDVSSSPCCAEDSPANQIAFKARLTAGGGLIVTIDEAVPTGDQVAIVLDYGSLFAGQISPCSLASQQFCQGAPSMGFAVRFYVGSLPAGFPASTVGGKTPVDGACMLLYNDALVDGDSCCYRKGGVNTCNTSISCNERSGSGCCLIYASENTAGGQRCCLYESGQYGDDASECRQLLSH
jgi:hypothetical protein